MSPQFSRTDPEFFTRMAENRTTDHEKARHRASRMIFLIVSLCIICFTAGMGIGIKFAGGAEKQIVDSSTYEAMDKIKSRLTGAASDQNGKSVTAKEQFPAADYPFALRVGSEHKKTEAKEIATFLSTKGHRVILSQNDDDYKIFIGPFANQAQAETALKKLDTYKKYSISGSCSIIKRT
jgi:preprotein translocase subunit SecF